MIIGNKPKSGEAAVIGKWYIGIEILSCPPSQWGVFRPYLMAWFFKVTDAGEEYKVNGRPRMTKGGWRRFTFPIGIVFKIERY